MVRGIKWGDNNIDTAKDGKYYLSNIYLYCFLAFFKISTAPITPRARLCYFTLKARTGNVRPLFFFFFFSLRSCPFFQSLGNVFPSRAATVIMDLLLVTKTLKPRPSFPFWHIIPQVRCSCPSVNATVAVFSGKSCGKNADFEQRQHAETAQPVSYRLSSARVMLRVHFVVKRVAIWSFIVNIQASCWFPPPLYPRCCHNVTRREARVLGCSAAHQPCGDGSSRDAAEVSGLIMKKQQCRNFSMSGTQSWCKCSPQLSQ